MICSICKKEFNYKPNESIRNKELLICDSCMIREALSFAKVSDEAKKAMFILLEGLAECSREIETKQKTIEDYTGMCEVFPDEKEDI